MKFLENESQNHGMLEIYLKKRSNAFNMYLHKPINFIADYSLELALLMLLGYGLLHFFGSWLKANHPIGEIIMSPFLNYMKIGIENIGVALICLTFFSALIKTKEFSEAFMEILQTTLTKQVIVGKEQVREIIDEATYPKYLNSIQSAQDAWKKIMMSGIRKHYDETIISDTILNNAASLLYSKYIIGERDYLFTQLRFKYKVRLIDTLGQANTTVKAYFFNEELEGRLYTKKDVSSPKYKYYLFSDRIPNTDYHGTVLKNGFLRIRKEQASGSWGCNILNEREDCAPIDFQEENVDPTLYKSCTKAEAPLEPGTKYSIERNIDGCIYPNSDSTWVWDCCHFTTNCSVEIENLSPSELVIDFQTIGEETLFTEVPNTGKMNVQIFKSERPVLPQEGFLLSFRRI